MRKIKVFAAALAILCVLSACGGAARSKGGGLSGVFWCYSPEGVDFKTDFPSRIKLLLCRDGSAYMDCAYDAGSFEFVCTYPVLRYDYDPGSRTLAFWVLRSLDGALRLEAEVDMESAQAYITRCGIWTVGYSEEQDDEGEGRSIAGGWRALHYQRGERVVYDSQYRVIETCDDDGAW